MPYVFSLTLCLNREKDSRKTTLIMGTSVFAFLTLPNTSKGLIPFKPTVVWSMRSTSSGPHLPITKLLLWPPTMIPPLLPDCDPQRPISQARPLGYVFSTVMVRIELGRSNSTLWNMISRHMGQIIRLNGAVWFSTTMHQNLVDMSGLQPPPCDLRAHIFELQSANYWLQARRRSLWYFEAWTGAKPHSLRTSTPPRTRHMT